ncbi:hypothetical protein [Hyphococcus luteus]|uniref:Uncharacterized protein n=1 Tax=Hyphococcus luteus TaxID=2058213 RepID=A0A2S7K709_9PROT|nr:hypothetical protein [Marinicaulis flavus]PQA88305.1 hypothetical protein CW354_08375 [Marinicaulis flavus]
MRAALWACDDILVDLEDRDVTVRFVHFKTHATVTVALRINARALDTSVEELKRRVEALAGDCVSDLASFLDGG